MEHHFGFPNPVERHDLPVRRRKWPWVLGGLAGLLLLLLLLLPYLLQNPVGRNLLATYLETRFKAKVKIGSLHTRWFGPTRVEILDFDMQGRHLRINSLTSELSLWNLLRGHYRLGKTQVEGSVEYVINYGDDTDTFGRLLAARPPRPAGVAADLPEVSGQITLQNVKIMLTRGQIVPERLYETVFRSTTLYDVRGTLDIRSLDQPCAVDVSAGIEGPNADEADGSLHLSGTLSLGALGKMNAAAASGDLSLEGRRVPNAATNGATPLLWLFTPWLAPEDVAVMFGARTDRIDAHCVIAGGIARFDRFEIVGQAAGRLSAHPTIDLTASPPLLGVEGSDNVLTVPPAPGLVRQYLVYVNPFANDIAEPRGNISVAIDSMAVPMWGNWKRSAMQGRLEMTDVRLSAGTLGPEQTLPRQVTAQWQVLSGDGESTVRLQQPSAAFVLSEGRVSLDQEAMLLDGTPLRLSGKIGLDGKLALVAAINRSEHAATQPAGVPQPLRVVLGGTIQQPKLDVAGAIRSVPSAHADEFVVTIAHALAAMRARATAGTIGLPPDPAEMECRLREMVAESPRPQPTTQP